MSLVTQVYSPTASINSGETVPKDTTVTLSCATSGSTIYYTIDGASPETTNGTRFLYSSPVKITKSLILRAYASKVGFDDSPIMTFAYKVDTVAAVQASIASGSTVAKDTTVTLSSSTLGANIYYTTDGTSPLMIDGARQLYSNPIKISKDLKILGVATKSGMFESNVSEFNYTVKYSLPVTIHQKWRDVLVCDNTSNLFMNYQWFKNDEIINGETKQYYQEEGGLNGSYYVTAVTADGSNSKSNVITTSSGIRSIIVKPNPVSQNQNFQIIINASRSELEGAKLSIYSLSGQTLLNRQIETSDIHMQGLDRGIYIIYLGYKDGSADTKKLIIY